MLCLRNLLTSSFFPHDRLVLLPRSSFCVTHLMFVDDETQGIAIYCSQEQTYETIYIYVDSTYGTYSSMTSHYWDRPR
jgi:hypothetical protein